MKFDFYQISPRSNTSQGRKFFTNALRILKHKKPRHVQWWLQEFMNHCIVNVKKKKPDSKIMRLKSNTLKNTHFKKTLPDKSCLLIYQMFIRMIYLFKEFLHVTVQYQLRLFIVKFISIHIFSHGKNLLDCALDLVNERYFKNFSS